MSFSSLSRFLIPLGALFALSPWSSSASALFAGVALSLLFGNPYLKSTKKYGSHFLSLAVVGLGAGMNLNVIAKVGFQGLGFTAIGIVGALIAGSLLGLLLKTPRATSLLISVGTAICGGSAIAAVAPVIRAEDDEISVSLGIVFLLNACALLLFPWLGHLLDLSQNQFGLWSALAIHDTSSVVGAGLQYGPEALKLGTTVKLARALWIIPVAVSLGFFWGRFVKQEASSGKLKKPWFILGFLLMAALMSYVPAAQAYAPSIEALAKRLLVLTLFLIGANITRGALKAVGPRALLQGVVLWMIVGSLSLLAIWSGFVHLEL